MIFISNVCIGKNGLSKKMEGDKKTPIGHFLIEHLYYRVQDRVKNFSTKLKCVEIKKNMGWCDDPLDQKKYNKLITINKKIKCEKFHRKDHKYDLFIPIKYNYSKPIKFKGSIFIHLTNNYKPTAGCIAMQKKDFLIMLKLINKKQKFKSINFSVQKY